MTDSTTGDLERRVARGICHSKGIDPDMCVAGHGAMPGEPGFICQQYAWELELPTTRAALKAHAEWLAEQGLVVVPDNDYSFWARVVELPQHRKEILYDFIKKEAEFAKS